MVRRAAFIAATETQLADEAPSAAETTVAVDNAKFRPDLVYGRRIQAADAARTEFLTSLGNGDEARYAANGYTGNFTKGLRHQSNGKVFPDAYRSLLQALEAHNPALLDGTTSQTLKSSIAQVVRPGGEFVGCDYTGFFVPPAPTLASARTAAETIELYWLALTRDVAFSNFGEDATIAKACADLSRLTELDTPRTDGAITPQTIFRGPGRTLSGPFLSQFFWLDVPFELGDPFDQRRSMPVRRDYLTDRASWLSAQSGPVTMELTPRDGSLRYMQTGRDLTDYLYQLNSAVAWRNAAAIIAALPAESRTPDFNFDDIVAMIALGTSISGAATLYQKMFVHRRLRPEALGGLVDLGPTGSLLHPDLWTTPALELVRTRHATHLLPQAYLEGSPTNPSYPAGHGTAAGTGVSVLKAVVNENYVLPAPMIPSVDGMRLEHYTGTPLTLGSELDKLATNCALGSGIAGVHYRSDSIAGLRVGEAAALSLMRNRVTAIGEGAAIYSLTTIDGAKVTIAPDTNLHDQSSTRSSH